MDMDTVKQQEVVEGDNIIIAEEMKSTEVLTLSTLCKHNYCIIAKL